MGTVTKAIADDVIKGLHPEEGIVRIVKSTNLWGGESYGLEAEHELGRYAAIDFVINPVAYWEAPKK
jgi:hypothetical protein